MFQQIDTMRMARDMGAHAAARQRQVAANVANADTPGYRARDIAAFDPTRGDGVQVGLRATRAGHVASGGWGSAGPRSIDAGGEPSPNGNTVSIEEEMVRAADTSRQFNLSLAVYRSGMTMLRTAIGRQG